MKLPTRADRKALRLQLREQKRAVKARLKKDAAKAREAPAVAAALASRLRRRRRRQAAILLAILALLLLRLDCTCAPPPAPLVAPALPTPPEAKQPGPKKKRKKKKKKAKLEGTADQSDRSGMALEAPPPPSWLPQFRMQVAARSPRLAACFIGAEKPGALRWSALVHARSGRVSESVLEPAFRGTSLDVKQLECLVEGLTDKGYELKEPDPQAAARRVSLIFEF